MLRRLNPYKILYHYWINMDQGKISLILGKLDWKPVKDFDARKLSREEVLKRTRHSSAHILATALTRLFGHVEFATGPATEMGFFYDVRPAKRALSVDDFSAVQEEMKKIVAENQPFEVAVIEREDAYELFRTLNQSVKLEVLDKIGDQTVTLYRNGDYIDLCAGPHVDSTGKCGHFQLLTVSAVHWKDEETPSLTRVTGTAWETAKDLAQYLELLEETKKRDHRVLGPQLELFFFHQWAGAALWQPNGLIIRRMMEGLWRETIGKQKYIEILNPIIYRKELFETSGHWQHYQDDMYIIRDENNEPSFVLKPMNCPDTMLYFASKSRSYRELPLRVAEGQILHRNEREGSIHGLMRTRAFVQDDAHIFLAKEHLEVEIKALMEMAHSIYTLFGLDYEVKLSTRPDSFMGALELWNEAEAILTSALKSQNVPFWVDEGDGAFYGPKIDISIKDSLGRKWQCGTIQLDFQLPERFDLKYSDKDGELKRPIVIHRAIFGSMERFIGILIEQFGGAFPTWLAPRQVLVLPITEELVDYAEELVEELRVKGIRAEVSDTSDSLNYRIRSAETSKIPYLFVVGKREKEARAVSIRRYSIGQVGTKPAAEAIEDVVAVVRDRLLDIQVKSFRALFESLPKVDGENSTY